MVAFDDSHLYLISKILNLISLLRSRDILLLGEQNLILCLELWSNFHSTKCLLDLQIFFTAALNRNERGGFPFQNLYCTVANVSIGFVIEGSHCSVSDSSRAQTVKSVSVDSD